jgi:hypothetical protein
MRSVFACGSALLVAGVLSVVLATHDRAEAAKDEGKMIAHNVYFSLKDGSPEARKKLVDACKKYLTKHPGEVFFAAGILAQDLDRPVNDRDFDVGLHIVFKDRASHDKYQDAERHKQFIEENRDNWKKVRVFDSVVEQ